MFENKKNTEKRMIIMITIEQIKKYGEGWENVIALEEEGQTLTLEVSQATMLKIAERYKYSGEQYGETGLEHAYAELSRGCYKTMWEMVRMMNPTLSKGDKESIYDFKHRHHALADILLNDIADFADDLWARYQKDIQSK